MPLYLTALNPTDAVTHGLLPAARRRGHRVVLLTDQPDAHRASGVEVRAVDVRDPGAIAAEVADAAAEPVALLSNSDHLQAATSLAARLLGLPGKDWRAAVRCKNKLLTRRALAAAGLDVVACVQLGPGDDPAAVPVPFPAVLKPREGVASEDVVLVGDRAELVAQVARIRAHRPGPLLVEEYLPGPLRTFDTLGDGTTLHHFSSWRTTSGPPPYFVESTMDWDPVLAPPLLAHLRAQLAALGVGFGACHTEFVEQGDLARIVEVNYRMIGDLGDLLCAELLDADLYGALIDVHLGLPLPPLPDPVALRRFARLEYLIAPRAGTFLSGPPTGVVLRPDGTRLSHRRLREPGVTAELRHANRDYLGVLAAIGPDRAGVLAALADYRRGRHWLVSDALLTRVLAALLREDHLGIRSRGVLDGSWWRADIPAGELRLPVRPDGFLAEHAVRAPVLELDGTEVSTVDEVLRVLAPAGDPEAECGWQEFTAECRAAHQAQRWHRERAPELHEELAAEPVPTGFAGLLAYDALAALDEHPVHPTGRCRHGMTDAEQRAFAPEHRPRFALRWAESGARGSLPDWCTSVPVHPLTADRGLVPVLPEPGPVVLPTLSLRTVALADDLGTHVKLPVPTATLGARNRRSIKPGTLGDGATVQRLLADLVAGQPELAEHVLLADEQSWVDSDSEYLAAMVRRYPSELDSAQLVPLAALGAPDPWGGGVVLDRLAGPDPLRWFESYLTVLFDVHVPLWLRHGITLEAHQQNVTLALSGDRIRLVYKDNDGARLDGARWPHTSFADHRIRTDDQAELADMFTTMIVHLCAGALAAGQPWRAEGFALIGDTLADATARWTDRTDPRSVAAADLVRRTVLDAERLPVKAMVTAGTLLPKQRIGCTDINKHYLRTGPNYLRTRSRP